MANKLPSLLDVFKASPKVFFDRPPSITNEAIAQELRTREAKDQAGVMRRRQTIPEMFAPFDPTKEKPKTTANPFL